MLLVEVRKNGKVGDVDVLSSNLDRENRSHRDLQRAAISTVKRWRYDAGDSRRRAGGTQVRVVVDIDLESGVIGRLPKQARVEGQRQQIAQLIAAARRVEVREQDLELAAEFPQDLAARAARRRRLRRCRRR